MHFFTPDLRFMDDQAYFSMLERNNDILIIAKRNQGAYIHIFRLLE